MLPNNELREYPRPGPYSLHTLLPPLSPLPTKNVQHGGCKQEARQSPRPGQPACPGSRHALRASAASSRAHSMLKPGPPSRSQHSLAALPSRMTPQLVASQDPAGCPGCTLLTATQHRVPGAPASDLVKTPLCLKSPKQQGIQEEGFWLHGPHAVKHACISDYAPSLMSQETRRMAGQHGLRLDCSIKSASSTLQSTGHLTSRILCKEKSWHQDLCKSAA